MQYQQLVNQVFDRQVVRQLTAYIEAEKFGFDIKSLDVITEVDEETKD